MQHVSLNDGGIWVTDNSIGTIGRFTKPIGELNGELAPPSSSTSVDVWQEGPVVAAYDASGGRIYAVNAYDTAFYDAGAADLARARRYRARRPDPRGAVDRSLAAGDDAQRRRRQPVRAVRLGQAARRPPGGQLRRHRRGRRHRLGGGRRPAARLPGRRPADVSRGAALRVRPDAGNYRRRCPGGGRHDQRRRSTCRTAGTRWRCPLPTPRRPSHCSSRRAPATSWSSPPARRSTA